MENKIETAAQIREIGGNKILELIEGGSWTGRPVSMFKAAPELLSAAEEALTLLDMGADGNDPSPAAMARIAAKVRAAIEKAGGR